MGRWLWFVLAANCVFATLRRPFIILVRHTFLLLLWLW